MYTSKIGLSSELTHGNQPLYMYQRRGRLKWNKTIMFKGDMILHREIGTSAAILWVNSYDQ